MYQLGKSNVEECFEVFEGIFEKTSYIVTKNKIILRWLIMNFQNNSKNPHAFPNVTSEEKNMAMLIWILNFLTSFIGPLIIWLMKKDESAYINQQGKNYLNFAICYTGYLLISYIFTIVIIGIIPFFAFSIAAFVYGILGIIKTNKGEDYVVPLTFPIIK